MDKFYSNAGGKIRELREKKGYTREKFAEIADISPKFIYEIETGQKGFSAGTLYRIAKGLCVSCEYILSGETKGAYDDEVINTLNLFNDSQVADITKLLSLIYEINTKK